MSGAAGAQIGTSGTQPVIGVYVQDALNPSANTCYIGINSNNSWDSNVISQDYVAGFTAPVNDNPATGGLAAWVKAGEALALNDRVNLSSGVATKNASGTNICLVTAGVPNGNWFWAPVYATT